MFLDKASRRWIASVLALVLVCLPCWTAAYACPVATSPASAVAMAGMTDCDQMSGLDTAQPQLCKAHCDRDRQTVNNAPAPDLSSHAAVVDELFTRLALWLPPEAATELPAVMAAHAGPPGGSLPVYLALQVLRH
jgi:hypothetical protein